MVTTKPILDKDKGDPLHVTVKLLVPHHCRSRATLNVEVNAYMFDFGHILPFSTLGLPNPKWNRRTETHPEQSPRSQTPQEQSHEHAFPLPGSVID